MRDTRREKEPTRHKDRKLHERCLHSLGADYQLIVFCIRYMSQVL